MHELRTVTHTISPVYQTAFSIKPLSDQQYFPVDLFHEPVIKWFVICSLLHHILYINLTETVENLIRN